LSERKGDDAVRVPIEIRTEDLSELQQLIQQLTEAEEASRTARASGAALPSKGAAGPQTFGGQAGRSGRQAEAREGAGGIFGGGREGMQAMPQTFRDRSGRQAMQRENSFNALQDQVKDMVEEQAEQTMNMMDQLTNMGMSYIPFIGGAKAVGYAKAKLMAKMKQNAGKGANIPKYMAGGRMAAIGAIAAKAGPIGAIIGGIIMGIMAAKQFTDAMQGPGGFWDIRYRRHIQKEMDPFIDRREKQEINIGLRAVRVTTSPAVRGTGTQVFSTHEAVRKGIPIYNGEFEAFSKGMYI
jgi:hypothetical protein